MQYLLYFGSVVAYCFWIKKISIFFVLFQYGLIELAVILVCIELLFLLHVSVENGVELSVD